MTKKTYSIVIPCLNEERTIREVVSSSKKQAKKYAGQDFEIVVADNGSTDKTLKILKKIRGVRIINVPVKGYGAALHWGIMGAAGKYVIFADADLSYPLVNIKKFIEVVPLNPDLVLGSRIKGRIQKGAMPFLHRYFGTPILTLLIRVIYKIPTTDCNSGMRMIKKSFYKKLNMRNSGMEWASELLAKASIKKVKYMEVPIIYKKDKRGRKPHLASWSDGWRHLKAVFLIKPQALYPVTILFFLFGLMVYKLNFGLGFLFFDIFVIFSLGIVALSLLSSVVEKNETGVSKFLKEFHLIPLTALLTVVIMVLVVLIPDSRLGSKLFLISILGIVYMWVFLIETIKTHLVNRLPDIK